MDAVWVELSYAGALALSFVVGLITHELGHAVAGWAVGLTPRLISIGRGSILLRMRVRSAWLVIRSVPISGFVHCLIGPNATRLQRMVLTAGGPSANVLLLAASCAVYLRGDVSFAAQQAITGCILGQLFILALSLIPSERKVKGRTIVTDALRFYRIARGDQRGSFAEQHRAAIRGIGGQSTALPPPSPYLPEIIFQLTRRDRGLDAWAQDDAAASMRRILGQPSLPDTEHELAARLLKLSEAQQRLRRAQSRLSALRGERPTGSH